MKRLFLLPFAALALSGLMQSAVIDLVANGSFEQGPGGIGSFTGWQTALGDASTFVDSSGVTGTQAGQASDGLWSAYFGSTAASGGSSISQALATRAGQAYLLTFDLANDNAGQAPNNAFRASLGGTLAFSASSLPAQGYAHTAVPFLASNNGTVLTFSAYNDRGYLQLDNVRVTEAPEPSSLALLLAGSLALGLAALKTRASHLFFSYLR